MSHAAHYDVLICARYGRANGPAFKTV